MCFLTIPHFPLDSEDSQPLFLWIFKLSYQANHQQCAEFASQWSRNVMKHQQFVNIWMLTWEKDPMLR